jgi:hypothetical protein
MTETEIYFCGSIRAGRGDVDLYGKIIEKLGKFGKVSFIIMSLLSVLLFKYRRD